MKGGTPMLVIGLAGGSGSGKGTASKQFKASGIPVFNCDACYHRMISRNGPLTRDLAEEFGDGVLKANGGIDRRALFARAFGDEKQREKLNAISHRRILLRMHEWIREREQAGAKAVLIDAPLLFEAGLDRECDRTVVVIAPPGVRIQRIVRRDKISREEAERRIAAQIPDEELRRRADCVLQNDGDLEQLKKQVEDFLNKIN